MCVLLSPAAAPPPLDQPTGRSERPDRMAQHQRRPERRQERAQPVPKGREERSKASTGALLTEVEGAATWGRRRTASEARPVSLPQARDLVDVARPSHRGRGETGREEA